MFNIFKSLYSSSIKNKFTSSFPFKSSHSSYTSKRFFSSPFNIKKTPKDHSRNIKLARNIIGTIITVFGLGYLAVPVYRIFCQMTGIGGDVQIKNNELLNEVEEKRQAGYKPKRRYTIEFTASTGNNMPWKFYPLQNSIDVYPGDTALAFFMAKNETNEAITGVATYNVLPLKAGLYFNKIQCFCFEEQRLQPNEEIEMPVFFFLDPEIESDARFTDVEHVMLSYTFFPVDDNDHE